MCQVRRFGLRNMEVHHGRPAARRGRWKKITQAGSTVLVAVSGNHLMEVKDHEKEQIEDNKCQNEKIPLPIGHHLRLSSNRQ
ncbi:hypothetical protein PAHAL_8G182300 [Panicum hallii]|uniref:Uncharacterized protein n=1 Tax=Panicum hallii TaxID=206008 RepID=A0A2S3IEB2_9POAL|nr:hypothetical protein PAHAL_8G182300 [Panicum hallii]